MSKYDNDALGTRMKNYEDITRYKISPKSYVLARIDGNAFHTYTRGLKRPFDEALIEDMDATAIALCKEIQNVKFAFVQSDEISLFLHEEGRDTQAWFGNNIQKMASISAAKATAEFNKQRYKRLFNPASSVFLENFNYEDFQRLIGITKTATFDARFWTVPSAIEVYNYFLWRQRDAEKNSISATAQSVYSHKELENMNGLDKQEMLFQKGINWNDYPSGQKRGRFVEKVTYINDQPGKLLKNDDGITQYALKDVIYKDWYPLPFISDTDVVRNRWEVVECPIFSQDPNFILDKVITSTEIQKS